MNTLVSLCILCALMYIKINICEYHVYIFMGYRVMIYDIVISLFGAKTCAEAIVEYVRTSLKYVVFMILGNTFRCSLNRIQTMYLCN